MTDFLIGFTATFVAGGMIGAAIGHGIRTRRRRGSAHRIPITTFRGDVG